MALPLPPGVCRGGEGDEYLSAVAFCRSFIALTSSLIRRKSLPRGELTREAILANRAQISGRETVATQRDSPDLQWRSLT